MFTKTSQPFHHVTTCHHNNFHTMALFSKAAPVSLYRQSKALLAQYCRWRTFFCGTISPTYTSDVAIANTCGAPRISPMLQHCTSNYAEGLHNLSRSLQLFMPQYRSMVKVTVTQSSNDEPAQQTSNDANATAAENAPTAHDVDDLTITQSCVARIQQLALQRPNPNSMYLRLYVDAGGCSGFQYKFLLLSEDDTNPTDDDEEDGTIDPDEDIVYTIDGARLVIDQTSLELLRGSTIDYVQEMIRSSFAVVNNPNSESACGCGSSFAVKKFQANPALD